MNTYHYLTSLLLMSLWACENIYCEDEILTVDYNTTIRPSYITQEQWLVSHLLRGYDANTRPVYNASDPVNVYLGITLTQIFDLDEKNQVLTTNVWLDQQWHDEKLIWDPQDYDGIKKLRIPCRYIWKPDIVLYNSIEDYTDGYMQSLAMVSFDGTVFWPPIVKFQSTCQIDITYFPFDDQICRMKLGSWAYDGFQVDVFNRSVPVDLSNYISNGEWFLVSVTAKRNVVTYPCCPEPFPDVVFTIHLRRRTLYYTHNVIIPCVMLSGLTLLIFWMSPDSGEKVTLGLTVLLAFSVFMLLIAENMPATSNFVPLIVHEKLDMVPIVLRLRLSTARESIFSRLILAFAFIAAFYFVGCHLTKGMYLTTVMGITSLSVVLAVVVSNIAHKGRHEIPLPSSLRSVVLGLARIMCVRLHHIRPNLNDGRVFAHNPRVKRKLYQGQNVNHASNDSACGLLEYELGGAIHMNKNGHTPVRTPTSSRTTGAHTSNKGTGSATRDEDIDAVLGLLKTMLLNEADKDNRDILKFQWQEAAAIIDRFLFFIFLVLTILVTLLTLVVLPLTKPETPDMPFL